VRTPFYAQDAVLRELVRDLGRLFLVVHYQPSIEETDGQRPVERGPPHTPGVVLRCDLVERLEAKLAP